MFQIVIYTCVNVYQLKAFVVKEKCVVYRTTCVAGRGVEGFRLKEKEVLNGFLEGWGK